MDGDLFLIRQIKENPVIWNSQHISYHDKEKRDKVFLELSTATNLEVSFLKRRWTTIRERYVKELRGELLQNKKASYKYMQELSYLKNFVKIKNSTEIQANIQASFNYNENEVEMIEFEITEEDLIEHEVQNVEDVFVEIQDEIINEKQVNEKSSDRIEKHEKQEIECNEISSSCVHLDHNVINYKSEQLIDIVEVQNSSLPVYQITTANNEATVTESNNVFIAQDSPLQRHEDVIFGELIASQLMKITDETKKRDIKRSILALLF